MYRCRICGSLLVEARPPVYTRDGRLVVTGWRRALICPKCYYVVLDKQKANYRQGEKWCPEGHVIIGFDGVRCPVHNKMLRTKPRRVKKPKTRPVLGEVSGQAQATVSDIPSGGAGG